MHAAAAKPQLHLSSRSGRTHFSARLSRAGWRNLVLGVLGVFALLFVFGWLGFSPSGAKNGKIGAIHSVAEGPWGQLTVQPVLIAAPVSILSPNFRLGDGRWYFRAAHAGEVKQQLLRAGITPEQAADLVGKVEKVAGKPELLSVAPSVDLVRSLSPGVRTALYEQLSLLPENLPQFEPFRMTDLHLDDWLQPGDLPPEVIAQVKSLLWRRGNSVLFSDYNLVADSLDSPAVKLALLEQLSRKASLVVKLAVPGNGDIEPLVRYWGFGGRSDKVGPLLQALARSGGQKLDVSNLLPVFARERLYRFPDPLPGSELGPGCHWSAFNFFNRGVPDESLHTPEGVEKILRENYVPATGEPRFGDIILLTLPDGSSIHSAVYIAGDIVFTKNGPSLATPFVFSSMQDMLAFYPSSERITLNYYRRVGT